MNSFLGEVIMKNTWSEVASVILYSNFVFHIKRVNAVMSCPKGMEKYLGMLFWVSKKSDCLIHPRWRGGGLRGASHAPLCDVGSASLSSVFTVTQGPLAETFNDGWGKKELHMVQFDVPLPLGCGGGGGVPFSEHSLVCTWQKFSGKKWNWLATFQPHLGSWDGMHGASKGKRTGRWLYSKAWSPQHSTECWFLPSLGSGLEAEGWCTCIWMNLCLRGSGHP